MNITINLTITPGTSLEDIRATLAVIAEYETKGATQRAPGAPVTRERGPLETAYLQAAGLSRMRLTGEMAGLDRETAAQVLLAQMGAGGALPSQAPTETPEMETPDAGEDWGE